MAWSNIGGGGENVTPEVQTQTPLIEDIKESLVGKATGANATEDTILEGYSAYVGQELVEGKYKPHGLYVWRKYEYESSTVGDFVDYVVSDTETAYPDDGEQGGFTYRKIQTTETNEITPGTTDQTIDALSLLLNTLTVKGDADLVAKNIRSGVDIFGVIGTMVQGKTGIDYGTVTLNGSQNKVTVSHNLGKSPSFIAIIPDGFSSVSYSDVNNSYGIIGSQALMVDIGYATSGTVFELEGASNTVTSSSITFWAPSGSNFISDTYYWFAVA